MSGWVVTAMTTWMLGTSAPGSSSPGLQLAESIPRHERRALTEAFERALPLACEPPPCTEDCSDEDPTLTVEIGGDSRDYSLHWVASDPRLDTPLTLDSRCELCSVAELEDQLAGELATLCKRLQAIGGGPALLHVSSDPSGARLRIDGKRRGRSPWSGELEPGPHVIELRTPGHKRQRRTVDLIGSSEEREHIVLVAKDGAARPAWPGWTSLGLGLALSVAGTALIALDGNPWRGQCSGEDIDPNGHCRYLYATGPLGIGLAAAGAGAIAAGVGLVVWAQRGPSGRTTAGLALRGRF